MNKWRSDNPPYYLSAYALACKRGYKGTVDEWLESITAYGEAVKNGFSGTKEEWLLSLTAYGLAKQEGFTGTVDEWMESITAYGEAVKLGFSGTKEEWIASLKGEKGDTGKSAYQYAVEAGYQGSEETFALMQLNSGKTAYEYAVEGGFEGSAEDFAKKLGTEYFEKAMALDMKMTAIRLPASGWSNGTITVSVDGVTSDSTQTAIITTAAADSIDDYLDSGVKCSGQGDGTLTFSCTSSPSVDLTVNVIVLKKGGWSA